MRKFLTILVLSIFHFCILLGQNAVLHITLAHSKAKSCGVYFPAQPKSGSFNLLLKDSCPTSYMFKLNKPEFVRLYCAGSDDWSGKHFNYLFYLSPGDDLVLKADFNEPNFGIKVSGKGSNNNQPLMSAMESVDLQSFYKDTLPYRAINAINAAQKAQENKLDKYIKLYNPSRSYINDQKISLRYYSSDLYYDFKSNNKNYVWEAYYRNYAQWQRITDSLFSVAKLDNDIALTSFHYAELINRFLYWEELHLSDEEYLHPEAFYREWYHTDTVEGKKQFSADQPNKVQEKIINRYFTGKTAEYLYAVLIAEATSKSSHKNIAEIFSRFKELYPNSKYIGQFGRSVDTIIENGKHTLNERMVFMADNGTKLNSMDEVLAAVKGKTVLVDMWGTWCGPCRKEIEKNSAAIREHFKNKELIYLYIANEDTDNQEQWKKLIAYFDMEGTHLLANKKLTDDIMAKIKGRGFPTLFIIKKDGSFDLSKSDYPLNRDILFKQVEEALAQ